MNHYNGSSEDLKTKKLWTVEVWLMKAGDHQGYTLIENMTTFYHKFIQLNNKSHLTIERLILHYIIYNYNVPYSKSKKEIIKLDILG